MRKVFRSLGGLGLVIAGLSLAGCATEEMYDNGPPPPGYDDYAPGWYDGYGYGYGVLDVGGYYGGWWGHDHHWHRGAWDARVNHGNVRAAVEHGAGGGRGGGGGHGGGGGGGGHR